jgi:hypothetical protein
MANILQIRTPDTDFLTKEKTFLAADTLKQATSLPVDNLTGFANTDPVAVGALFSEGCEGSAITSTPANGALPVAALVLTHPRGTPVTSLVYNKFKLYRSATQDGTYADVTSGGAGFDYDQQEFYYRDAATGVAASNWYKVTWYNSVTQDETPIANSPAFQANAYSVFDPSVLRRDYLLGVRLVDFYGNPLRDETILRHTARAISHLETYLGTVLQATNIVNEEHHYWLSDYVQWGYMKLFKHPIISITSLTINFPENQALVSFPTEWIRMEKTAGQIALVPTYGSIVQFMAGYGVIFPLMMGAVVHVPNIWRVSYRAGFEATEMPKDIEDIVYKMTALSLLNIIGDTVFGPGVASRSVSIDGLSQSVGTVANAQYNTFSARMTQFQRDVDTYLPQLKQRYQGVRMIVC